MRIQTLSLIATLICVHLVLYGLAEARTRKKSSVEIDEESTTPFLEMTDSDGLEDSTSPEVPEEMWIERLDNTTRTTQPESKEHRFTGRQTPNRMHLLFLNTSEEGRTLLSPKFCAFNEQLQNATNAFLSRAPPTQSDQPTLLKNALRQEGKRRTKELGKILSTFLTTPTAKEFPRFWIALNDLDLEPATESAKRENVTIAPNETAENGTAVNDTEADTTAFKLRNALTKLCKAKTLDAAKKVWREDAPFWKNVSAEAHVLRVLQDNMSSAPEKIVIRELAKIPRSQKNAWEKLFEKPFYHTPTGNATTYENRDQLQLELHRTCLWIMRVEYKDRAVRKLVDYLSHDWRKVKLLFPKDAKLSSILDTYCTTVSKMYASLDLNYYFPWATVSDTSDVALSKGEYDFYLDFIGQKFYSSMYRDTARTLLIIHGDIHSRLSEGRSS